MAEKDSARQALLELRQIVARLDKVATAVERTNNDGGTAAAKQLKWTIAGAWLVAIYTVVTGVGTLIGWIGFHTTTRPAAGIDEVQVLYGSLQSDGFAHFDTNRPTDLSTISAYAVRIIFKNFGTTPAFHMIGYWTWFQDGKPVPGQNDKPSPITLYQGKSNHFVQPLTIAQFHDMQAGRTLIEFNVNIDYDGPAGHYHECIREEFVPNNSAFADMGETCR